MEVCYCTYGQFDDLVDCLDRNEVLDETTVSEAVVDVVDEHCQESGCC